MDLLKILPDEQRRIFRGHDEESLARLLEKVPEFELISSERVEKLASDGKVHSWFTFILRKI